MQRGEGLKAANKKGKQADPIVKLSLGKQTFSSKTILHGTKTEPRWNAKFEFKSTRAVLASSPLKLNVFDRSLSGKDSLGNTEIDLSPLLFSAEVGLISGFRSSKKYYTVELTQAEDATSLGRLYLSVSWECDDDSHVDDDSQVDMSHMHARDT